MNSYTRRLQFIYSYHHLDLALYLKLLVFATILFAFSSSLAIAEQFKITPNNHSAEFLPTSINTYPTYMYYKKIVSKANRDEKLILLNLLQNDSTSKKPKQLSPNNIFMEGPLYQNNYPEVLSMFHPDQESGTENTWMVWTLVLSLSTAILGNFLLWGGNRSMLAEIQLQTEEKRQLSLANKRMVKLVYTDQLTGMGNRRSFYEEAEIKLNHSKLYNTPLATLMIDIDHFKNINDKYGHAIGDLAIKKLAEIILEAIRPNDIEGRIGGEEFAIVTINTSLEKAEQLANQIRSTVEHSELDINSQPITMTVSIGVTAFDSNTDDIDLMLARADKALYQAKNLGRNRVVTITT